MFKKGCSRQGKLGQVIVSPFTDNMVFTKRTQLGKQETSRKRHNGHSNGFYVLNYNNDSFNTKNPTNFTVKA